MIKKINKNNHSIVRELDPFFIDRLTKSNFDESHILTKRTEIYLNK
jgi:hypothetical protein